MSERQNGRIYLKSSGRYHRVSKDIWEYFHKIYGGGPEIYATNGPQPTKEEVEADLEILKHDMEVKGKRKFKSEDFFEPRESFLWITLQRTEEFLCQMRIFSGGEAGAATAYQVKQLEQQNERLKEAVIK